MGSSHNYLGLGMSETEVNEYISDLETSSSKLAIALAIYLYGSMNLKSLSNFIGRAKSTLLAHIKSMVKSGYLEIDSSEKIWGKYYRLTPIITKIFQKRYVEYFNMSSNVVPQPFKSTSSVALLETALDKYSQSPHDPKREFIASSLQNTLSYNIQQFIIVSMREHAKFLQLSHLLQLLQPLIIEDLSLIRTQLDAYVASFCSAATNEIYYNSIRQETEPWKFRDFILHLLSTRQTKPVLRKIAEGEKILNQDLASFPHHGITTGTVSLPIQSLEQLAQVSNLISDFLTNLTALHDRYLQENDKSQVLSTLYVHLFAGELPQ